MPRWPAGMHRHAAAGSARGPVMRRPPIPPATGYTGTIRQVPLTEAQGQTTIDANGNGVVSLGPQGMGTVWYPASVTVSTSTGVDDASVANVYAGPAGILTPTTLLGTIPSGGAGVLAVAIPPLPVGWQLAVVWSGGNTGDVAAVNVTGSKDAMVMG